MIMMSQHLQVYDHILVNDDFDRAYGQLKDMMIRYRPDVMIRDDDEDAAAAAASAVATPEPVLVLTGPPGATGARQLSTALSAAFPDKFKAPQMLTDRKPDKGETSTPELQFVGAKDLAKMSADGLIAFTFAAQGGSMAVSKEALQVGRILWDHTMRSFSSIFTAR